MKVLVVDDDQVLAEVLSFTLRREGFEILLVGDGEAALRCWAAESPDIILLDVNLPKLAGFQVCRQIREQSDTPIIMLTVREEEDDIVQGLGLGADDYITKPFSPRQLVARVQAVLRRAGKRPTRAVRRVGRFTLMPARRELQFEEREPVELTRLENRLLDYLLLNAGRVLSAEAIIDLVWGAGGGDRDMLRQLVYRLRRKTSLARGLLDCDAEDSYLETVPGLGYGFMLHSRQ
ncbi:MAG: response regulator transcription factor [Chloroflexota bacterium]|nr:response regulator transcription factor [Chloroflexota bacterium]